jgi:hypothetical protein
LCIFGVLPEEGPQEGAVEYQKILLSEDEPWCRGDVSYLNLIVMGHIPFIEDSFLFYCKN